MNKNNFFIGKKAVIVAIISTFLICSLSTAVPITNSSVIHENIDKFSLDKNTIQNSDIKNINELSYEINKIYHNYLGLNQNEKISIGKILRYIILPINREINDVIKYKKTFDEIPNNLKNLILSFMELTDYIDINSLINENLDDNIDDFEKYWGKFEEHNEHLDYIDANDMEQITDDEWIQDFTNDLRDRLIIASFITMAGSIIGLTIPPMGPFLGVVGLILFTYALRDVYAIFGVHETWNFMDYWKIDIILNVFDTEAKGVPDLHLDNTIKAYSYDVKLKSPNDEELFTYNFGPIDLVEYIDEDKSEGWYILSNWPKVTEGKTEWNKPPLPPGNWRIKFEEHDDYIFQNDEKILNFIESRDTYLINISYPEIDTNPNTPATIETEPADITEFKINQIYTFKVKTNDPEDQKLYFKFNWSDGTYTDYNDDEWVYSDEYFSASHTLDKSGRYEIRVKAKDGSEKESWWSLPKIIEVEN